MISTALVPTGMYDAQCIDVIRRIGNGVIKAADTAAEIKAIKETLRGICIEGALSVLDAFKYHGTHIHYNRNRWEAEDLADERYFPDLQGRRANETPVFWFWGGPPDKLKWYKGTLQTLLEDRILCEIMERGAKEVARWVGTDLGAAK